MRILHVSSARAFGGGERHLVDLTRGLSERGHDVRVVITPKSPLRARLGHLKAASVHTLPLRNALDLPSAFKLARLARQHDVAILHAHVARDYPIVALAARLSGARLVITRHVLFPLGRAHRLALANVARVIAVSDAVERALQTRAIFPLNKVKVIPNGVDIERIEAARAEFQHATEHDAQGRVLRVGTVGSLVENKGHDLFIRAAASVISRVKAPVEFIIVGDETPRASGYRETLERLIAATNLEGRVRLHTHGADPLRLFPSLDLFVSASRSEAFGLAMAEALACGVPVVATATDGAQEVVEHDINGTIVPTDDAPALASAIISLLEDTERRSEYAEAARASARRRFDLGRMVSDTERVYLEALSLEDTDKA